MSGPSAECSGQATSGSTAPCPAGDATAPGAIHVVKLGGSLLDMPELFERLSAWQQQLAGQRVLLLVGGGDTAETVSLFDAVFHLDETRGHWLAVRAMQFNAHLVAAALPGAVLVADAKDAEQAWASGRQPVVDPLAWLEREEAAGVTILHRWTFTSDSIAAHLARRLGAQRLSLLKSVLPRSIRGAGDACTADEAAVLGIVDKDFAQASRGLPGVELVNFRAYPPTRCVVR